MPEGVEVEVLRNQVVELFKDQKLGQVIFTDAARKMIRIGDPLFISGGRLNTVKRSGKYLYWYFDRGIMVMHLGAMGNLVLVDVLRSKKVDGIALATFNFVNKSLCYIDASKAGRFLFFDSVEHMSTVQPFKSRGVDIFDLTPDKFMEICNTYYKMKVKDFLLSQFCIAGIGSLYATEIMWGAKVHPFTRLRDLSTEEKAELVRVIGDVLCKALCAKGTSLGSFVHVDGGKGFYGSQLKVYGREGKACAVCGSTIVKLQHGNRSCLVCERCQAVKAI